MGTCLFLFWSMSQRNCFLRNRCSALLERHRLPLHSQVHTRWRVQTHITLTFSHTHSGLWRALVPTHKHFISSCTHTIAGIYKCAHTHCCTYCCAEMLFKRNSEGSPVGGKPIQGHGASSGVGCLLLSASHDSHQKKYITVTLTHNYCIQTWRSTLYLSSRSLSAVAACWSQPSNTHYTWTH